MFDARLQADIDTRNAQRRAALSTALRRYAETLHNDPRIAHIEYGEDCGTLTVHATLAPGWFLPSGCPCCLPSDSIGGHEADEVSGELDEIEYHAEWV